MTKAQALIEVQRIYGPEAEVGDEGMTVWLRRRPGESAVQSADSFEDAIAKARMLDQLRAGSSRSPSGGRG